jgi:hypothetical protein
LTLHAERESFSNAESDQGRTYSSRGQPWITGLGTNQTTVVLARRQRYL